MAEKLSADDLEGAEEVKPGADMDDHDLDFLKPGYRRPAAKAVPAAGEKLSDEDLEGAEAVPAGPEDRIGRAARAYADNTAALAARQPGGIPEGGDKVAPYGLSGLVTGQGGQPAPVVSGPEAVGRGAIQGASLGWGDEVAAAADTLISKVPGVRSVAEKLADKAGGRGASLNYANPDLTYEQRRDAYRRLNEAAKAQHGRLYTTGEIGGGIATALARGMSLGTKAAEVGGRILPAIAPSAIEVGGRGALLGTIAGAGGSNAATANDVARDALESGAAAGAGSALLHTVGSKVVAPLAQRAIAKFAGKAASLADKQATQQLTRNAPQSLTDPLTRDANLSAAINEPIQVAPKKSVTLAEIAGKPAEEVRPVVAAKQAEVDKAVGGLLDKTGKADLADVVGHYDQKIGEAAKQPGNEKVIHALEDARQEAIEHWGPTEAEREAKLADLGKQRDELYAAAHEKVGGTTLGDLVKRYDDEIATVSKQPGNEPYVDALTKARDSAVKAWGTKPVLDPNAVVEVEGKRVMAGPEVDKLEKMAASSPEAEAQLRPRIDSIRDAASREGVDLAAKVPAKDVRAYATKLQSEGATSATDPKLAAKARQYIGTVTKDFVNQHVGDTLGGEGRKALEGLNRRTTDVINWPDIVSGKNADNAARDRVLGEFGQKVSPRELDEYARKLEQRGTQRINKLTPGEISDAKENLAKATREFADKHAAKNLSAADLAEYRRQQGLRSSLKNIDSVLERRQGQETANKFGLRDVIAHGTGAGVAAMELAHAVPKVLAGDIGGAASHVGSAIAAGALPFAAKNAGAIGRAAVRGAARGADFLANVVASADAGNPWARRQIDLLRQAPGGAARLAAAVARMKAGGGGGTTGVGGEPP